MWFYRKGQSVRAWWQEAALYKVAIPKCQELQSKDWRWNCPTAVRCVAYIFGFLLDIT